MNFEKERKAFEDWISTKEWIHAGMSGRNIDDILVFDDDYQEYHFRAIQECWEAWQASSQRQGYKLVPVEPTEKMIVASFAHRDCGDDYCIADIYKEMIRACDE